MGFNKVAGHYDSQGNPAIDPSTRAALWIACIANAPNPPDDKICRANPVQVSNGCKLENEIDIPATPAGTMEVRRNYRSDTGSWSLSLQPQVVAYESSNKDFVPCLNAESATFHVRDCFKYWTYYDTPVIGLKRLEGRQWYFAGPDLTPQAKDTKDVLRRRVTAQGEVFIEVMTQNNHFEQYLPTGHLVRRVRHDGVGETYTYSDSATPPETAPRSGLLIAVADSFGRSINLTYTAAGSIAQIRDVAGQSVQYSAASGIITSVTFPDLTTKGYIYDEPNLSAVTTRTGLLTGIQNENGSRYANFGYFSDGKANLSEHAGGVSRYTLTYPSIFQTKGTDALGSVETFQFLYGGASLQNRQQLTSLSQTCSSCAGGVRTTNYSYDANGNISSRTDFNANVTNYTYDLTRNLETRRVEAVGKPAVRTISTQWHPDWRLEAKRAEAKKLTTWVYHGQPDPSAGNAIAACAPSTALLPDGKPIAVLCKKIEQATTDATGAAGFAATVTGSPRSWTWTYNGFGQMLTANGPRTDVSDTTTYSYYASTDFGNPAAGHTLGDLWTVTNPAGHVTEYLNYDKNGRPLAIKEPNGIVTTLSYSPRGWLKTRQVGNELTTYDYDAVGQLKKVTLPDGSWIGHDHDAAHRLVATYDNRGNRIAYTLDAAGNRTREDVTDPQGTLVRTQTRIYDALSRLQNIVQPQ